MSSSRPAPVQLQTSSGSAPVLLQSSSCPAHDQVRTSSESAPDQIGITALSFSPPVQTRSESDRNQIGIIEQKRTVIETRESHPPPPLPPLVEGEDYENLRHEVLQRTALRRLSSADERELSRLAQVHGSKALEACQHLHSGIKNATGYLKVILEGREGPDAELESFTRFVRAHGLG